MSKHQTIISDCGCHDPSKFKCEEDETGWQFPPIPAEVFCRLRENQVCAKCEADELRIAKEEAEQAAKDAEQLVLREQWLAHWTESQEKVEEKDVPINDMEAKEVEDGHKQWRERYIVPETEADAKRIAKSKALWQERMRSNRICRELV